MEDKLRKDVKEEYTWDLSVIYKSDSDWEKEYKETEKSLEEFVGYKGNLSLEKNLFECLKKSENISLNAERIYVYSNLKLHEDTGNSFYQGFADRAESLIIKFSASTSFIESEILSMSKNDIDEYINKNPQYKIYKHYFDEIFRLKAHILDAKQEELLAKASEIGMAADNIYSMINDADMTFDNVIDENGNEISLTHGKYISLMESSNPEVRKNVFKTYYKSYINLKNTFSATFNANVKKDLFFSKARNFNSSLENALFSNNIPVEVYTNLIKTTEEFLPYMHKYIDKRNEKLELSEIHIYDLYTPFVKDIDISIDFDKSKETVIKALAPLGEEYINVLKDSFENRWIDVYENKGKRSGAYSWGVYGAHPFVLLNFQNKINDMFTLAHEMGHALHSHYSWTNQEYLYSDYTIFVAEVASTVNEALLMEYLLKESKDKVFKEYLINYYIDQFRTTLFRQTMFAEFEMITHNMVLEGYPLTVDSLNKVYRDLNLKYYGDKIILDSEIDMEWARIPHFYSSFYVYQYATGFSAAVALSKKILKEGMQASPDYINFLKGGSSDYSISLLRGAGVDMSKPEPIKSALEVFKELVESL